MFVSQCWGPFYGVVSCTYFYGVIFHKGGNYLLLEDENVFRRLNTMPFLRCSMEDAANVGGIGQDKKGCKWKYLPHP